MLDEACGPEAEIVPARVVIPNGSDAWIRRVSLNMEATLG